MSDEPRRAIITGATGLLGRQVYRVFEEQKWNVRGLGHERAKDPIVKCDLLMEDQVEFKAQLDGFQPAVVVHCAAERRPDRLEGKADYADKINAQLPREIAELCRERNVWMIYLSTNYVFDGKDAPYAEDAPTSPLSTYGQSKLDGERAVMKAHPHAAVLRVPLLYGPLESLAETSVTALLPSISADAPKFDNWQERFPTSSEDLAGVLEAFCAAFAARGSSAPDEFAGCFHWQANQRHTKYTMAVTIAEIDGAGTDRFVKVDDAPPAGSAPRPQFERMLCTRIERLLGIEGDPDKFRSDFKESLARYLEPFLLPKEDSGADEPEKDDGLPARDPSLSRQESKNSAATGRESPLEPPELSRASSQISRRSGSISALSTSLRFGESSTTFAGKEFDDEKKCELFKSHVEGASHTDG
jgi:S-adenosylmethionine synthetase